MKKIITAVVAVFVLVPMLAMSVWAAGPEMSAKAGAATVDGVISEGEYGDPFVLNKDNAITWTDSTLETEIRYYFAWAEDGLYVATSIPSASVTKTVTLQLNFNPGNLIPEVNQGLFLGMSWSKGDNGINVTQHNHGTAIQATLDDTVADISDKVTSASKDDGTNIVFELKLPVDFFKIVSLEGISFDDFKMEAGATLGAAPFAIIFDNQGGAAAFCALASDSVGDWSLAQLKLGSISFQEGDGSVPSAEPSSEPSADPSDEPDDGKNPTTFDLGIVSLAAVALSSVVAMKKRK